MSGRKRDRGQKFAALVFGFSFVSEGFFALGNGMSVALQCPFAQPAVLSVLAGVHPGQLQQNIPRFGHPIPPGLWVTRRERGLLDEDAPCSGRRA